MVWGALQTKQVRSVDWVYRWLPPAGGKGPQAGGQAGLSKLARGLLDRVERRWRGTDWDWEKAVVLRPTGEGRQALEGRLLSGNISYGDAWYCPRCEKALWLLEREPGGPHAGSPAESAPEEETPAPPPEPPAERPAERPRPRDDPWEEPFGWRKKPDWEK